MTGTIGKHFDPIKDELADVIRHFYCIQSPADFETQVFHLSPTFDMMFLFNFGAPVKFSFGNDPLLTGASVLNFSAFGPLRKMLNYEVLPDTDLIAVMFTLDGFYRLFQIPIHELEHETQLNLNQLVDEKCLNELWTILKQTVHLNDRIQILSNYILGFTTKSEQESISLLNGVHYFDDPYIQPVKAIAEDAKLSERSIQTRFRKYTGYSPKEMLRFIRFKQVLNHITTHYKGKVDWFELIGNFGYHDQSHLIKDFKHYLGVTPKHFLKQFDLNETFCMSKPGKHY